MRIVNISNANVFGLSKDLGLKGIEYNTSLVIFFVPVSCFRTIVLENNLLTRLAVCMFTLRHSRGYFGWYRRTDSTRSCSRFQQMF